MDNYTASDTIRIIHLGGKAWNVPPLSVRQNKIIDPLILGLLPVFSGWHKDHAQTLTTLSGTHYDALLDIAFTALGKRHPELTRDAFCDLPVTLPELIAAFTIIAQQTGIFQREEAGEQTPGEAQGA